MDRAHTQQSAPTATSHEAKKQSKFRRSSFEEDVDTERPYVPTGLAPNIPSSITTAATATPNTRNVAKPPTPAPPVPSQSKTTFTTTTGTLPTPNPNASPAPLPKDIHQENGKRNNFQAPKPSPRSLSSTILGKLKTVISPKKKQRAKSPSPKTLAPSNSTTTASKPLGVATRSSAQQQAGRSTAPPSALPRYSSATTSTNRKHS